MARVSIIFGLLLCGLSAAGMLTSLVKHPIQFVPLMFGIPVLFCGVVGLNPHRRRISMHAAAGLTTLATVLGLTRVTIQFVTGALNQPPVGLQADPRYVTMMAFAMAMIGLAFTLIHLGALWQGSKRRQLLLANPIEPHAIASLVPTPPTALNASGASDGDHAYASSSSGETELAVNQVTSSLDP
ncbi:hypothetical protein N9N28_05805 [Rubripirellula amarantea]|uniref:Uncharacterized protein n=1 Tax=Rubripirellula amarantea TaxID=2527999 RepID=A0A5C5WUQ7_9BACT|nr:hypothetical protein [Rubripirellula amarantea]MDA8744129.1 hypothetical protein [Rubripirellula amarantea]TWT54477.1 hypothetical protein Pla22_21240 [Rubripirellula amarantea]